MNLTHLCGGVATFVLTYLISVVLTEFFSPLRSIPGPFWARFTRLWFFNRVYLGNFERDNIRLHQLYGSVVRVAPNTYSINAPDAINTIYGVTSKMPKSDWYEGWKHPSPDHWTLFSDRNTKRHAETKRRFHGLYSMSSLLSYETFVNECTDILQQRLSECHNETINMTHWLQCYAFDVIGNITYSQRFGFLDHGEDVACIMKALRGNMMYSTLIGIFPALHPYAFRLMNMLSFGKAVGRQYLMAFVQQRIQQHKEKRAQHVKKSVSTDGHPPQSFLEKLMTQNEDNPQKITSYHLFMMGMSNIVAGADTTAISLSAVLYNLIRHPSALHKLREEVEHCISNSYFDGSHLPFKQSQEMPYLSAVIKEALRLHPATGLPLWRVVTEGGLKLDSHLLRPGTVVGLNSWVAHYNEDVFGRDAKQFRPERWIEGSEDKLKRMNAYYMPFGLGSRTCLGKHISFLEMSKLIPVLVKSFDFELQGGPRDWKIENYWFVMPVQFSVKIRSRRS